MLRGLVGTDCDRWLLSALESNNVSVDGDEGYASAHNAAFSFANRHRSSASILVTTSTAGGRAHTHEISRDLLATVLRAIRSSGFFGQLSIADGTAFGQRYEVECERLGYRAVAAKYEAEIIDLNRAPGLAIEHGWWIARPYLDADCRISLVKAKTHRRFGSSLALKSVLGAISGAEHGFPKLVRGHEWVPWLVDRLLATGAPTLCVIDGIAGIEGEGPMRGTPTGSRFVVSGESPVAVDAQANIEMGFDPALVPMLLAYFLRNNRLNITQNLTQSLAGDFEWYDYRHSLIDFLPSRSCYWLHRSLRRSRTAPRRLRAAERLMTDILREEPESLREM